MTKDVERLLGLLGDDCPTKDELLVARKVLQGMKAQVSAYVHRVRFPGDQARCAILVPARREERARCKTCWTCWTPRSRN